jgi:hypothetical protein
VLPHLFPHRLGCGSVCWVACTYTLVVYPYIINESLQPACVQAILEKGVERPLTWRDGYEGWRIGARAVSSGSVADWGRVRRCQKPSGAGPVCHRSEASGSPNTPENSLGEASWQGLVRLRYPRRCRPFPRCYTGLRNAPVASWIGCSGSGPMPAGLR